MKKYLLFCVFVTLAIPAICQYKLFENYFNKFKLCSLPINSDSIIKEYSNTQNSITLEEFDYFIKDSNEVFWKYELYSNNAIHFFEYHPLCKFEMGKDKIGLLYSRSYFDNDMTKEKTDIVLSIYDLKGSKVSYLSIAGSRFDNFVSDIKFDEVSYKARITENYNIEITYSTYCWKDEKEHIIKNHYSITSEGKIIEIK
jgi:hypothetical protein